MSIDTAIYSDTWRSYSGLDERFKDHQVVDHGQNEYRRGNAYINGIEGFWAYAKERLLRHHEVIPDKFLAYLKEKEFRFNHRDLKNEELVGKMLEVLLQRKHSTKW